MFLSFNRKKYKNIVVYEEKLFSRIATQKRIQVFCLGGVFSTKNVVNPTKIFHLNDILITCDDEE